MTRRRTDAGVATVLSVALLGLLLLVGAALGVVAALVHAHREAQAAADLAALAAAHAAAHGEPACPAALRVAAANGAVLEDCAADGQVVLVAVAVEGPHWLGQTADLRARARAGPAG